MAQLSGSPHNDEETHIINVLSHVDNGETVGVGSVVSRATVVSRINDGKTYMTITKGTDSKWKQGAPSRSLPLRR